mgnify:CR=1 FL=1
MTPRDSPSFCSDVFSSRKSWQLSIRTGPPANMSCRGGLLRLSIHLSSKLVTINQPALPQNLLLSHRFVEPAFNDGILFKGRRYSSRLTNLLRGTVANATLRDAFSILYQHFNKLKSRTLFRLLLAGKPVDECSPVAPLSSGTGRRYRVRKPSTGCRPPSASCRVRMIQGIPPHGQSS